ncbi:MAG: HEAT repeat domain-containing protein [Aestuariibaculum sp.]
MTSITELKQLFTEINKLKSKASYNRSQFCSALTETDDDAYLELHFTFLQQKKRYFQPDLKMYFGFRQNKEKVYHFLKSKQSQLTDEQLIADINEILADLNYYSLNELQQWISDIKTGKRNDTNEFVWAIRESPFVALHYNLIKDEELDQNFRRYLKTSFEEHQEEGETFLLSKLSNNEDTNWHGDIIFILGTIQGKQSEKILNYARKLTESTNNYTRNRAIIVLGWHGKSQDFDILKKHLLTDTDTECRAWSATAFYIVFNKIKSETFKKKTFSLFQKALDTETDYFVLSMIIYSMIQITNNKFRISQVALNTLDKEQIDAAKGRIKRFINKYYEYP